MAVWRREKSGGFERRRATVVPVPIGTALHQLCLVASMGRDLGCNGSGLLVSDMGGERERGSLPQFDLSGPARSLPLLRAPGLVF
ncbi:hypothetical protein Vadar_033223 [Vaccinium darrowii]|uniref:Uncharacterized protein n=1 Tax=Vaccinium darrowii TaxID=229202 RepID=A0ACB7X667_9ERIC|nr:hypothetical protein Vadar_033223 [Vaccinium darrowii]